VPSAVSLAVPVLPPPIDEPPWLGSLRRARIEALGSVRGPSIDDEDWRYSPIGGFDPDRYTPSTAPAAGAPLPPGLRERLKGLPAHGGGLVVVDGHLAHRHLSPALADRGVVLAPISELADGEALLAASGPSDDAFAAAADAYAPEPLVLRVPRGVVVDEPLVIVQWSEQDGSASYGRVVVDIGPDAQATVLEVEASAPIEAFRSNLVDLRVAPAARLRYLNLQDLDRRMWRIATQRSSVDAQGSLAALQVVLGGAYARTRSECRLVGRGATGDLLALYFGSGDQVLDFRTFQHHEAPDTTSNLLFKGAVGGHARSIYTGLIRVHPDGRGTNAFQTNRNLKLSEHAWADSIPNLEIENNDVRCSHASTVSPVDEEQRFYLESRGIPPEVADRLIVVGFFDEVLEQLPVPELTDQLRARLVERFVEVAEGGPS
jgi:Fe-S cluster assembly protein SufD